MNQDAIDFYNQQSSPNTTDAYKHDLQTWFMFLGSREPTREIAIEYRKYLEGTYSPRTAARRFNTARAFYRWTGGDNVFQSIKSPARLRNATPTVPMDSAIERILESASNQRDRAVITLLLNGLRASEVITLSPTDFVWSPEYGCHIIRVVGKGNKQRLVPATIETSREVSAYLQLAKRGVPWLLGSLRGNEAMTRRQVTEVLRRACKRAGIPEINPHALRHHFGTRVWRSSKNLLALQALMGHESPVTTQVYVHLDLSDVVAAVKTDPRNMKGSNVEDYVDEGTTGRIAAERASGAAEGLRRLRTGEGRLQ